MDKASAMTIIFRCAPELEAVLPKPIPAVQGLPEWFKKLSHTAFNPALDGMGLTVKKCPPFIDAMTYGFMLPLVADLKVENGEFTWERDVPLGDASNPSRSPIAFHDPSQVKETPFFDEDRFIIKFNNFWSIQTPPGYSLLITHPVNRADLPFQTITGLVDCDTYHNLISLPVRWIDEGFNGVLPKGTPVAQCMPVRREQWALKTETMSKEDELTLQDEATAVAAEFGSYRRQFRVPKR